MHWKLGSCECYSHQMLRSTCSEPGPGPDRGMTKTNRQLFLLVLRGVCVGSDVCLPDLTPGLTLPWVLFLAPLCLGLSICKMGVLRVPPMRGCSED